MKNPLYFFRAQNSKELGKIYTFNSTLGIVTACGITYLDFANIPYNPLANYLLWSAMIVNFGLALWNYKNRSSVANEPSK